VALGQAFLPHGSRGDLIAGAGLDAAGIRRAIEDTDPGVLTRADETCLTFRRARLSGPLPMRNR
jgi:hypothetical protein